MDTALLLVWLVMCVVITDAKDSSADPEYSSIVKGAKEDLEKFIARKNLGGLESVPLGTNGDYSSGEGDSIDHLLVEQVSDFEAMSTYPRIPISEYVSHPPLEQFALKRTPRSSEYKLQVDSIKGMPGVHFPDYTDIPETSFSCADKPHIPGFYADLDTGCQVFHACWNDRRETFLCPMGTTFNQALMTCDYWYSSNCSQAPHYYSINEGNTFDISEVKEEEDLISMIDGFLGSVTDRSVTSSKKGSIPVSVLSFVTGFLPVKAKVSLYSDSEEQSSKIADSTSDGSQEELTKSRRVREVSSILRPSETWAEFRNVDYKLSGKLEQILEKLAEVGLVRDSKPMKPKCESHAKPTLKPKFITRPVAEIIDVAVKGGQFREDRSKSFVQVKSSTLNKVGSSPFRQVQSSASTRVTISEKTKKALLINYIRLIKIKANRSL